MSILLPPPPVLAYHLPTEFPEFLARQGCQCEEKVICTHPMLMACASFLTIMYGIHAVFRLFKSFLVKRLQT